MTNMDFFSISYYFLPQHMASIDLSFSQYIDLAQDRSPRALGRAATRWWSLGGARRHARATPPRPCATSRPGSSDGGREARAECHRGFQRDGLIATLPERQSVGRTEVIVADFRLPKALCTFTLAERASLRTGTVVAASPRNTPPQRRG